MVVNATTLARTKALLGDTGTVNDALLTTMISAVSRELEGRLGYPLEQKERTEFYSPTLNDRLITLNVAPLVSVAEVRTGIEGKWDFTTGLALVADQDYRIRSAKYAELYFVEGVLVFGFETLRVKYTAGLGVDDAGVIAAAPDLALAADEQVAEEWRRRADPQTVSRPGPKGATVLDSPLRLLPRVEQIISRYRRLVVA